MTNSIFASQYWTRTSLQQRLMRRIRIMAIMDSADAALLSHNELHDGRGYSFTLAGTT